jgi:heme/copper-type cytochrome/quinol oxidase subunit 3
MTALLSGLPPVAFASAQGGAAARPVPTPQPAPPAAVPLFEDQNASQTRERLRELLNQYPPTVGQVLRLDPSLMARPDYMGNYPALAAFVAQHPAIAHNPSYFLGASNFGGQFYGSLEPRTEGYRAVRDTFMSLFFLLGFVAAVTIVGWIARSLIEYRAWLRASKVQTEFHTKLVDRLTSNEDVLAYMQSPVGQKFLTSTTTATGFGARAMGSPVGRILWSVQLGIVLALGGLGLFAARNNVIEEAAQALAVVAELAIALGIGFVLSALVAYALSRQLGLIEPRASSSNA